MKRSKNLIVQLMNIIIYKIDIFLKKKKDFNNKKDLENKKI